MVTTVDLDPEAYRLAEALAAKRRQSIGQVLSDAVLSLGRDPGILEVDAQGWPIIRFGRPMTADNVRALTEED